MYNSYFTKVHNEKENIFMKIVLNVEDNLCTCARTRHTIYFIFETYYYTIGGFHNFQKIVFYI